jgi:hypothetical protein
MKEMTKIVLKSSLAIGLVFGLTLFSSQFFDSKLENESDESQSVVPTQHPPSEGLNDLPVGDNPVISVSSNSLAGDEKYSPKYLLQESRTIWHAESPPKYPQWVEMSFPTPVVLTHLGLRSQGDSPKGKEHGRGPKDFIFQGSNESSDSRGISNSSTWVDLLEVKNNAYVKGEEWKDWFFKNAVSYRYYRIFIKAGGDPEYLTIRQIRVDQTAKLSQLMDETPKAPVRRTAAAPVVPPKSFVARSVTTSGPIPRAYIDPPNIDPMSLRKKSDAALQQAGVKTKEEAMKLSLALWEKRRKAYFS